MEKWVKMKSKFHRAFNDVTFCEKDASKAQEVSKVQVENICDKCLEKLKERKRGLFDPSSVKNALPIKPILRKSSKKKISSTKKKTKKRKK